MKKINKKLYKILIFMLILLASNLANKRSTLFAAFPTATQPVLPAIPEQTDEAEGEETEEDSEPEEKTSETMPSATKQEATDKKSAMPAMSKSASTDMQKDSKEPVLKDIYLNFENTDLLNFINYMAEIKKLNLIPDKSLEGAKVSLSIREPLTVEGAWNIFLTVLEMAGFSIIQAGDVHKVIPKDQKLTQPLPAYINVPASTLPDNDSTIRYVVFLENLNVTAIRELLESMLSDQHRLIDQKEVNGFIITDKALNIKSAMKVIQELDSIGQPEALVVIRLKSANAVDVKELLNSLMKDQEQTSPLARLLGRQTEGTTKYFPSGTRIIAEERTNSLILLGSPEPIKKIEDFITNHVDTELKAVDSPLHIYELQYTEASQIAEILREVTTAPEGGPGQKAAQYGAIRGGVKYFKSMTFTVDKDGNRLIVSSTDKEDWELLRRTIEDLDKPQPQIAVETMLVSIDDTDTKQVGGALRNKKHGQIGKGVDAQSAAISGSPSLETNDGTSSGTPISLLGNMISQLVPAQGSSILSLGKPDGGIWGVFNMLKVKTTTSILSQPFLTIANKTKALIEVGKQVNVLQEEGTNGRGFTRIPASTKLEIEPQINLDGIIRMQISVNIDEFTDEIKGTRTNRNLNTNVTVADGQVLVLGGFVQTKVTENKQKTPILGDIPLLGWLFKQQKREIIKSYIFIFLAPTIIKPRQTPGINPYTKMKLHQVTDELEANVKTTKTPDPLFNWFFNHSKENYSHKIIDYANARYQPITVDIQNDPYYRSQTKREEKMLQIRERKKLLPEAAQQPEIKVQEKTQESVIVEAKTETKKIHDPQKTTQTEQIIIQSVADKKMSQGQAQDEQLEEKRKKLRELLTQSSLARQQREQPDQNRITEKEQFKEFISPLPKRQQMKEFISQTPPVQEPQLNVNPAKRKQLKNFLSQTDEKKQPETSTHNVDVT